DSIERTPMGTPFNVGVWVGPDGESVLAALNPGSYSGSITTDLSKPLPPLPADPAEAQVMARLSALQQKIQNEGKSPNEEDIRQYFALRGEQQALARARQE